MQMMRQNQKKELANKQPKQCYVKACGKALIAGGYGVLQKNNIGLTLALQNYFYCRAEHVQYHQNTTQFITVISPQISKQYHYEFSSQNNKLQEKNKQQNPFVQNALFYSLKFFNKLKNYGQLKIILLFDKGFISDNNIIQEQKNQKNQAETKQRNQKFKNYSENYAKTGLGSSACVIVSIVRAICKIMDQNQNKNKINVISQVANMSAQKKIGSNFDISTAIYGTHLYKNILPEIAYKYSISQNNLSQLLSINPQIEQLKQINYILLNKSVAYMIDVSKGANTRTMVSNFLKNLKLQTQMVQKQFYQQSKLITKKLFDAFVNQKINTGESFKKMKEINSAHRKLQQKFSKITKTSVEPQQLTDFLNDLMLNQNILYVICPGSGGFDALFMLALKDKQQQYYEKQIQYLRRKHQKTLGKGVNFKLKQVNVKWNNTMQVQLQQIQQIESFLLSSNLNLQ